MHLVPDLIPLLGLSYRLLYSSSTDTSTVCAFCNISVWMKCWIWRIKWISLWGAIMDKALAYRDCGFDSHLGWIHFCSGKNEFSEAQSERDQKSEWWDKLVNACLFSGADSPVTPIPNNYMCICSCIMHESACVYVSFCGISIWHFVK